MAMADVAEQSKISRKKPTAKGNLRILRLLALFKFGKALLLIAVGFGALGLIHPMIAEKAQVWAARFAMSYNGWTVHRLLSWVVGLPHSRLEALGIAAFVFAGLFTTEGIGLWRGKRWGEYLTTIATSSLVPFELYELAHKATPARFMALTINVALVAYLVYCLRQHEPKAVTSS
jgi:uncharacterized membrane protein (DUF2068 family)